MCESMHPLYLILFLPSHLPILSTVGGASGSKIKVCDVLSGFVSFIWFLGQKLEWYCSLHVSCFSLCIFLLR